MDTVREDRKVERGEDVEDRGRWGGDSDGDGPRRMLSTWR